MSFKFDLQRFGSKGSNVELSIPDEYSSAQKRLTGDLSDNLTSANRRFNQDLNGLGGATREANQSLLSYKDSNSDINNIVNLAQVGTLPQDQQATDDYTQALDSLIGGNSEALEDATGEYNGYIGQNNSALRNATSDISGYKQQTTNALRTNKTELDAAKKQAGEDTTIANGNLDSFK